MRTSFGEPSRVQQLLLDWGRSPETGPQSAPQFGASRNQFLGPASNKSQSRQAKVNNRANKLLGKPRGSNNLKVTYEGESNYGTSALPARVLSSIHAHRAQSRETPM